MAWSFNACTCCGFFFPLLSCSSNQAEYESGRPAREAAAAIAAAEAAAAAALEASKPLHEENEWSIR